MSPPPLPLLAFVDLGALAERPARLRPVRIPRNAVASVVEAGGLLAEARARAADIEAAARHEAARLTEDHRALLDSRHRTEMTALAAARDAAATMILDECRSAITRVVVDSMRAVLDGTDVSARATGLVRMLLDLEGRRLREAVLKVAPGVCVTALPELPSGWSVEPDAMTDEAGACLETPTGRIVAEWIDASGAIADDAHAAEPSTHDPYAFIPIVTAPRATPVRDTP